jgi:DNA-binding NtrC family response regulator
MPKKRILVADGDPDVSRSICEFLQDDYEVYSINDGNQVISTIENKNINLLLTDIEISNDYLNNHIIRIKEKFPHIPIFMMYVYCDYSREIQNTIRSLADAIFFKPFDLNDLKERIEQW